MLNILKTASLLFVFSLLCQGGAADVTYNFTLDTAPLIGHPAGPFYLYLEFIDGSGIGDGNNTVSLSDIELGGGTALGGAVALGGASGSLSSGVTMKDVSFLSLFSQQFVPGFQLNFSLGLTLNDDAGGTPDRLSLFLLDSSGVPLPTLAPVGDYFLGVDLRSSGPVFDVYASDPSRAPTTGNPISMNAAVITLASSPEPPLLYLFGIPLVLAIRKPAKCRGNSSLRPEPLHRRGNLGFIRHLSLLALVFLTAARFAAAATGCATNLIQNGNFETGTAPNSTKTAGSTDITGWTVLPSGVDWINGVGAKPDIMGTNGSLFIDLNGNLPSPGGISQTFATQKGIAYQVFFDMNANTNVGAAKSLQVSAGSQTATFTFTPNGPTDLVWQNMSFVFVATDSVTTLIFQSLTTGTNGGPLIDNVQVYAGPNLIQNGNFETGTAPNSTKTAGSTDITGWTVLPSGVDWINGVGARPDIIGTNGSLFIDLNGSLPSPGGISQTFATQKGIAYQVFFDMNANTNVGAAKSLQVSAGSQTATFTFTPNGSTDPVWRTMNFVFTATDSVTTLVFQSLTTGTNGGPLIDNVQVFAGTKYLGCDTITQGNWIGPYGADGDLIANRPPNSPAYATVTVTGDALYTWASPTSDSRALQASSSNRIASTYYSASAFEIDVNITDGGIHRLALYLLDWDSTARAETITLLDAATNTVLYTRTFSGFHNGQYVSWNVQGNVLVQISHTGGANAVVSGIFFDPASSGAAASYVGEDTATQGSWTGIYGSNGYSIAADTTSLPAFAALQLTGDSQFSWANPTSDVRALQTASASATRIASTYYSASTFTIDLNLTGATAHKISLYLMDWDTNSRVETISLFSGDNNSTRDTRSFSGFHNGQYAIWTVKGHVLIQVTKTSGSNAVVSGIFID